MTDEVLMSQEGYDKLKAELADLKGPERQRIADNIREAKSHGDLRENAMYHEAKLNQTRLEARISELERLLQYATIIETASAGKAGLGSQLDLEDVQWGNKLTIELVGSFEADPLNGRVSVASPMGSAMMEKSSGEIVDVKTPSGIQKYKIISIR